MGSRIRREEPKLLVPLLASLTEDFIELFKLIVELYFLLMAGGADVDIILDFGNFCSSVTHFFSTDDPDLLRICVLCRESLWFILSFRKSTLDCEYDVVRFGEVETGLVEVTSFRVRLFLDEILLGGAGG